MLRLLIPNGHLDYGIGARSITYLVSLKKKKLCITFVFLFLLGIKVVPREIVNKPLGKPKSVSLSFNSWADNSFPFFFLFTSSFLFLVFGCFPKAITAESLLNA